MTDSAIPNEPFGIGRSISATFGLFFKNPMLFLLLAFVPTLLAMGIQFLVSGAQIFDQAAMESLILENPGKFYATQAINTVVSLVSYGITTGLLVYAAYDVILGNPPRIGGYFAATLSRIVPLIVVMLIAYVGVCLASMALIVPGLWLAGVLMPVLVIVVLETEFFGAFRRSAQLTKGYRWPIVGGLLIMVLVLIVCSMLLSLVTVPLTLGGGAGLWLAFPVLGLISAFMTSLIGIWTVLVYTRLREIKEGMGAGDIVKVFE